MKNPRKIRDPKDSRRKVAEAKAKLLTGYYDRPLIVDLVVERLTKKLLGNERAA